MPWRDHAAEQLEREVQTVLDAITVEAQRLRDESRLLAETGQRLEDVAARTMALAARLRKAPPDA